MSEAITVRALHAGEHGVLRETLGVFGTVFDEPDTYGAAQPDDAYLARLLGSETFVAVAAFDGDTVIGALAAYILPKFEQARSECYIYDLGVLEAYRRRGVASALIRTLGELVRTRGVYVIFVQADHGDDPAIALYTKLGSREDVLHFDIEP